MIEHVANPIKVIEELFRVCKVGGKLVLSAPDKDYTFDKPRALTPFQHLLDEYKADIKEVSNEHYIDFLYGVHPEVKQCSETDLMIHVENVRRRREHAHVWDSNSFAEFLEQTLKLLNIQAECLHLKQGAETNLEYFSVWQKQ